MKKADHHKLEQAAKETEEGKKAAEKKAKADAEAAAKAQPVKA